MAEDTFITPASEAEKLLAYRKSLHTESEEILRLEMELSDVFKGQIDFAKEMSRRAQHERFEENRHKSLVLSMSEQIKEANEKILVAEKGVNDVTRNIANKKAGGSKKDMAAAIAKQDIAKSNLENLYKEQRTRNQLYGLQKQSYKEQTAALLQANRNAILLKGANVITSQIGDGYERIKNLLTDMAGGGLGAFVSLISLSFSRFIELDKAAGGFRKKTGLMISQMGDIAKNSRELNVQYAGFGVGIREAYDAAAKLKDVFQTSVLVSKDMQETTALLAANIGVSAEDSAKVLQLFNSLSKSAGTTSDSLTKTTIQLAKSAGVAPKQIFEDMARSSQETLIFLGKNPMELMRTAIAARAAGTNLDSMAKSARGLLNFQDSINSEMEASALLGKSVNFQLARQLAFSGDIEGSRKAALNQIKQAGDLSRMNVYQQEALAKASGMTVKEIIEQQNQEKMLAAVRQSGTEEQKKMLREYEASNEALKSGRESDITAQGVALLKDKQRQMVMENINNSLSEAMTALGDSLLPIANAIMPAIVFSAKALAFIFTLIGKGMTIWGPLMAIPAVIDAIFKKTKPFASMVEWIGSKFTSLGASVGSFFMKFKFISKIVGWVTNLFSKIGGIGTFLGPILKIGSAFFKWIPIIGWIVTGIQFVMNLIERVRNIEWGSDWGENIMKGLSAVGGAIYDTLLKPFVDIWDWLSATFFGNSPSQLGLSIVKGISSVGSMMFDFLVSPFTKAWEFIKGLPFIKNLFGGSNDITSTVNGEMTSDFDAEASSVVEIKNLDILRESIDKLTAAAAKIAGGGGETTKTTTIAATETNVGALGSKLDELISLMKNGGIAVNLDGRLVSKGLATSS